MCHHLPGSTNYLFGVCLLVAMCFGMVAWAGGGQNSLAARRLWPSAQYVGFDRSYPSLRDRSRRPPTSRVASLLLEADMLVHRAPSTDTCGMSKLGQREGLGMRKSIILVAVALVTPALAQDAKVKIPPFVGGAGATRCDKWLSERDKKASILASGFEGWTMGFVSGVHLMVAEDRPPDFTEDDVLTRTDFYCREHRTDILAQAAFRLTADLLHTEASRILQKQPLAPSGRGRLMVEGPRGALAPRP
jgi:hypothetical protein